MHWLRRPKHTGTGSSLGGAAYFAPQDDGVNCRKHVWDRFIDAPTESLFMALVVIREILKRRHPGLLPDK